MGTGEIKLIAEERTPESVLRVVSEKNVRLIILQFVDILGNMKRVAMPAEHLENDMVAVPDLSTFRILPGRSLDRQEARIICDITRPGNRPFEGDPRHILRKTLFDLRKEGYQFNLGPELEFFLLQQNGNPIMNPIPHDQGGYFDYSPLDLAFDIRRDAIFELQQMGFNVEMSHHEVAPGQHEIDFKFEDALLAADRVVTYKTIIKSIALARGLHATFMPKPFFGQAGSGMHVHQSLFDIRGGKNVFFSKDDKYNLSDEAYYFIGGQLVNSYKRLTPGYEAPVYICWGRKNRSALIRVPEYYPGKENAVRAELRCPDPSCNPYLAFTAMLKAGLKGIEKKITPPDPVEEDVYEFDDRELAKFYIKTLPASLGEALAEMSSSTLVKEAIGEFAFEKYLEAKKNEWDDYRLQVSDWEIKRYLRL
jgi:glutamine synthetase